MLEVIEKGNATGERHSSTDPTHLPGTGTSANLTSDQKEGDHSHGATDTVQQCVFVPYVDPKREIEQQSNTIFKQFAGVRARKEWMKRRDILQAKYDAAVKANRQPDVDKLGKRMEAIVSEGTRLSLSAEDYSTLTYRHGQLVEALQIQCDKAYVLDMLEYLDNMLRCLQALSPELPPADGVASNTIKEMVRSMLQAYLPLKSLVKFDRAVLSRRDRPTLHNIYRGIIVDVDKVPPPLFQSEGLQWLERRSVFITAVTICSAAHAPPSVFRRVHTVILTTSPSPASTDPVALLTGFPALQHLTLMRMNITDIQMAQLADAHPNLLSLSLPHTWLTNSAIEALAMRCSQLQFIDLKEQGISDDCICTLVQNCKQLRKMDISSCASLTDRTFYNIAEHAQQLEDLCVTSMSNDISLAALTAVVTKCKMLSGIDMSYPNGQLCGSDAVAVITTHCHRLKWFTYIDCGMVSAEAFSTLCVCSNLTDLSLNNNRYADDHTFLQIIQGCPLLENFSIVDFQQVTDATVCAIAEHSTRLRSLALSKCGAITNASVIDLARRRCATLEVFSLSHNDAITEECLLVVLELCKRFKLLRCQHCRSVQAKVVELQAKLRGVQCT